jgi:hypothetical protein
MANDQQNNDSNPKSNINPAQLYDMKVPKGKIGGLTVNIWDKVRNCTGLKCELFSQCPYMQNEAKIEKIKENRGDYGVCRIEQKYLHAIMKPFWALLEKVPDEFVMQHVGMHLIPLYHDLVQLKMEKAKLKEITYTDSKGTKRIHPVYDQLLKTHKEIHATLKSSGLLELAKKVGFMKPGSLIPSEGDLEIHGDGAAYDEMADSMDDL